MIPIKSKKQREFEEQALPHTEALYRFSMRLWGNPTDADDLMQETYIKAYRFWDTFEQGTNVRAWLFRIMKNSFINVYRKGQKEPEMVDYCDITKPSMKRPVAAHLNDAESTVFNT
jgi:RNA polymerase sigma-70 factor, ECF subfamily